MCNLFIFNMIKGKYDFNIEFVNGKRRTQGRGNFTLVYSSSLEDERKKIQERINGLFEDSFENYLKEEEGLGYDFGDSKGCIPYALFIRKNLGLLALSTQPARPLELKAQISGDLDEIINLERLDNYLENGYVSKNEYVLI